MKGKHLPHWLCITIGAARLLMWCLLITIHSWHTHKWNEKALCAEGLCTVPMVPFVPLLLISKHTHKLLNFFFCLFGEKPELAGCQCGTTPFLRLWPHPCWDLPAQLTKERSLKPRRLSVRPESGLYGRIRISTDPSRRKKSSKKYDFLAFAGTRWCVKHS